MQDLFSLLLGHGIEPRTTSLYLVALAPGHNDPHMHNTWTVAKESTSSVVVFGILRICPNHALLIYIAVWMYMRLYQSVL